MTTELALQPPSPNADILIASYVATLDSPRSREAAHEGLRRIAKALDVTYIDQRGRVRGDAARLPWGEMLTSLDAVTLVRRKLLDRYPPSTANLTLAMLRGVLRGAFERGLLTAEQHTHIRSRLKSSRGTRQTRGHALTAEDIRAALAIADATEPPKGPMMRAILLLGIGTGLRRAELCRLPLACVDRGAIHVHGKGGKALRCPVDDATAHALEAWLAARPAWDHRMLFGSPARGYPLAKGVLCQLIAELGRKTFAAHDLRRTFASSMLEGGLDLSEVQRLMHHASPDTTARYDKRGEGKLAERRRGVRVY